MNTEQKAKAYDEALKQVKKELAACGSMNCDAARLIFRLFPQLCESCEEFLTYLEKQKEQKPVQSEDEREYVRIIKSIVSDFIRDKKPEDVAYYQKIYDWLDRRHVEMKESNPAEWSEEDEKMLQRIIRHTESEYQDWCNDKYGNSEIVSDGKRSCLERLDWLENRLKSLRPQSHWKPSREQMEALKRYSPVHHPDVHLVSLYDDLKKLM